MSKTTNRQGITIYLRLPVYNKLKLYCERERRTMSELFSTYAEMLTAGLSLPTPLRGSSLPTNPETPPVRQIKSEHARLFDDAPDVDEEAEAAVAGQILKIAELAGVKE